MNELDRIAKRHNGLGLLQRSNKSKKTFNHHMSDYGLIFWLVCLAAFAGFMAVITALQGLRVLFG